MTLVPVEPMVRVRATGGNIEAEQVGDIGADSGAPDTPVVKEKSLDGAVIPEAVDNILKW